MKRTSAKVSLLYVSSRLKSPKPTYAKRKVLLPWCFLFKTKIPLTILQVIWKSSFIYICQSQWICCLPHTTNYQRGPMNFTAPVPYVDWSGAEYVQRNWLEFQWGTMFSYVASRQPYTIGICLTFMLSVYMYKLKQTSVWRYDCAVLYGTSFGEWQSKSPFRTCYTAQ